MSDDDQVFECGPGQIAVRSTDGSLFYEQFRMGQAIFQKNITVRFLVPKPRPHGQAHNGPQPIEADLSEAEVLPAQAAPAEAVGSHALGQGVALVQEALEDPRWDFRTIHSLATATTLPEPQVREILTDAGIARRPWGRTAADLFTTVERKVSSREVGSLLRVFLAKRP